jgi:hypothetical protein
MAVSEGCPAALFPSCPVASHLGSVCPWRHAAHVTLPGGAARTRSGAGSARRAWARRAALKPDQFDERGSFLAITNAGDASPESR